VAQGSKAGYRVKEVFAGQTSSHEAVARTSSVSGSFTVQRAASGLVAQDLRFAAQLADLQSADQVAGLDVGNRDRIVSRSLGVQQYAEAVFQAASAAVPDGVAGGATESLTVPGQLTIHGITRSADARVQAHLNGGQLELAGTSDIVMTDFGVEPPRVPITTVQPQVTIEFQLVLNRVAA
jgi:polyisoprenoid-binding protein YceI